MTKLNLASNILKVFKKTLIFLSLKFDFCRIFKVAPLSKKLRFLKSSGRIGVAGYGGSVGLLLLITRITSIILHHTPKLFRYSMHFFVQFRVQTSFKKLDQKLKVKFKKKIDQKTRKMAVAVLKNIYI